MSRSFAFAIALCAFGTVPLTADNIYVSPGDHINTKVNSAQAGDAVLVAPGHYGTIYLTNKQFNAANPLVVKNNGSGTVSAVAGSVSSGHAVDLNNCRYIVFEGISLQGGLRSGWVTNSQSIVFKDCVSRDSGREGIPIMSSRHIDTIGGRIHDTGKCPGYTQFGEAIDVGSGSSLDYCSRIWIENVEFYHAGRGKGINLKPGVSQSTVRSCLVRNIAPGTSSQYNEGANSSENGNETISRQDNWIANTTVRDISGGQFNRGITFFGGGSTIKNTTVYNCASSGIHGNHWANRGYVNYVHGDDVYNCDPNYNISTPLNVSYTNPGNTPYGPQTWYGGGGAGATPIAVYGDALAGDWTNWSWNSTVNLNNASPVQSNSKSIAVTATAGWSAFSLRKGTAQTTAGFTQVTLWVHGESGPNTPHQLSTGTGDSDGLGSTATFTATAGQRNQIVVNLASLGSPSSIQHL